MANMTKLAGILFLAIFFAAPASTIHGGNNGNRADKVMLSLRIAKAKQEARKIEHYKSIARQRKYNRSITDSHLSSAQ
ncbi:MAG: hypothetical protein FWF95_02445 [Syntrophorhabdaceae bacterium]|nr:hypothetical protein [Syntrophorhabdaceae bacterium]